MINLVNFRHIAIIVNDYAKMVNFYSRVLGFQINREFKIKSKEFQRGVGMKGAKARVAHLSISGTTPEIEIAEYFPKIRKSRDISKANAPGYRHIALVVTDLKKAYQRLKKLGIDFFSSPICISKPKNISGVQFVYLKDPEGNIIELNQLPDQKAKKKC